MQSITVTKRFRWSMAHRLDPEYEGLCKNVHGHEYMLDVTMRADALDSHGMLVDFGMIKAVVGEMIKRDLDHAVLVSENDHVLLKFLQEGDQRSAIIHGPTTAESIVMFLAHIIQNLLIFAERGIQLTKLRLYETSDSWCDWVNPDL